MSADERGLLLREPLPGTWDVWFDGRPVWSFTGGRLGPDGTRLVPWPENMRPWLDGVAELRVVGEGRSFELGEVRFGSATGRVSFVDRHGIPVVVDKWGIVQRPFDARDPAVTTHMVATAERILTVLREDCGIEAWMAFGTLLGAVREGGVIGHDADIDLAFLSDEPTPAGVARQMFAARRALSRAGFEVVNKTASFLTVRFTAPDGAAASIDLYACFYVGGLLHETATVRAPVPRSAVLPLTTLPFEGRSLPAPADPDTLLTASYGPSWRTPDPSFRHRPGPEVTGRFDSWFGTVMRNRRDWEVYWRDSAGDRHDTPSPFLAWALARVPGGAPVLDVGAGNGRDALAAAEAGHPVVALEYARGSFARFRDRLGAVETAPLNLYDARDAVSRAALLARRDGPRVVYARSLLDALDASGVDNFWRFVGMVLRGGGWLVLEFAETPGREERFYGTAGRRYPVSRRSVERRILDLGGEVAECAWAPPDPGPGPGERAWRYLARYRPVPGVPR